MSDEEIRDLLDVGTQDVPMSDGLSAQELWSTGRRQRSRGRAWGAGLGAAAAAAGILGIFWAQGLGGGGNTPLPPATQSPSPSVEVDSGARGEPYLAVLHRANTEPPWQLSGASEPAALEDLQGSWVGPAGEEFTFDEDLLVVVSSPCHNDSGVVELTPEGRLRPTGGWDASETDGVCPEEEQMTPWWLALHQEPTLSLDGATLLISGLDGSTDEARVPVALTLQSVQGDQFTWVDGTPRTGLTPITLGPDFALLLSAAGDGAVLDSIHELTLTDQPGIAAAAQDPDIEVIGHPSTCPLEMVTSLRSDGVLLGGAPTPFSACAEDSDALAEPSPAVVALLRSGPTVGFDSGTMVISGTIPESLLDASGPPDDTSQTSEPVKEDGTPTGTITIPNALGSSTVVVMSEGGWDPSGELAPLTAEEAGDRRWFLVELEETSQRVHEPWQDYGLTFDDSRVHVRACSVDVTVPGTLQDGTFVASGDPIVVADPDPSSDCPVPVYTEEWVQLLTSTPRLSTDGSILVIAGRTDDGPLAPVGMALLGAGIADPTGGPTRAVTTEDLAAGLTEVPADSAVGDIGVSDHLDLQPAHATTLTVTDGILTLDVGCPEPLRGPAWFSQVGPEQDTRQLTAVLPLEPSCAGPGTRGTAAGDAELWRQMLAQGTFLHHFGDYVILDAQVDAQWAGADGS